MMKYKKIPGNLNFAVNPIIDFENSPFILSTGLTSGTGRKYTAEAGVNFNSGANAHIVLEEIIPLKQGMAASRKMHLFVLS